MSADTPAAAIQWGSYARQRTVVATVTTLADAVAREGLSAPVITVIGPVVNLREEIAWFDQLPLFGRRVVVTRASAQASGMRDALSALGAEVLELPALRIEPLDRTGLRAAVGRIAEYDWVVVTSQNAVGFLWDALYAEGKDVRALAGCRVACVGRSTSDALLARGLLADVIPQRFVAEAVLETLKARDDVRGRRVLYVAAEGARELLPDGLRQLGCTVDVIRAYRSVSDGTGADVLRDALDAGNVDLVTFASASAVRDIVEAVGARAGGARARDIDRSGDERRGARGGDHLAGRVAAGVDRRAGGDGEEAVRSTPRSTALMAYETKDLSDVVAVLRDLGVLCDSSFFTWVLLALNSGY
jgi:Uroporphyrinogen-III synthase